MKCKKCNQEMHKIGPFADYKPESKKSQKWDDCIEYECINEKCSEFKKIIRVPAGEETEDQI